MVSFFGSVLGALLIPCLRAFNRPRPETSSSIRPKVPPGIVPLWRPVSIPWLRWRRVTSGRSFAWRNGWDGDITRPHRIHRRTKKGFLSELILHDWSIFLVPACLTVCRRAAGRAIDGVYSWSLVSPSPPIGTIGTTLGPRTAEPSGPQTVDKELCMSFWCLASRRADN